MKEYNKSISIIIPCSSEDDCLNKSIDSILNSSLKNFEVLLVGDIEELEEYKDDKIKYYKEDGKRINKIIRGIKEANNELISILLPGDKVSVDFYRSMLSLELKEKSDIVISNYLEEDSNGVRFINNLLSEPLNNIIRDNVFKAYFTNEGLNNEWNYLGNRLVKKAVYEKIIDKLVDSDDFILFNTLLFLESKKISKIENDFLIVPNELSDSYSIEELNENFSKLESILKEKKILDDYKGNIQNWKNFYYQRNESRLKRKDLDEFNPNYKKINDFDYYYTVKTVWNDGFEKIKKAICDESIKCVSFDIFDTLVYRPFLNPTDLFSIVDKFFRQWTNNRTAMEFTKMRVDSEKLTREIKAKTNPKSQEVTLDEIYETFGKRYRVDDDLKEKLKKKEIEEEIRYCLVRHSAHELYELAKYLGKKVICTSDMYLPSDVLKKILDKNDYEEIDKIYVSAEYDITKAQGDLYNFVVKDNGLKPNEVIHIGDNYVSDFEHAKEANLNAYHLPKASDVFFNKKYTNYLSAILDSSLPFWIDNANSMCFLGVRTMVAVVANMYFDNPYRSFNDKSDFNSDPYLIGYYCLGMYMFGLTKWMLDDMQKHDYNKIVFMARDGYLPIQCYKLLKRLYKKQPKEEYLYISRKALIPVIIQDKMDFYKLTETLSVESVTPMQLVGYIDTLINFDEDKFRKLCSMNGINPDKKMTGIEEFNLLMDLVINNFYDKEKQTKNLKILTDYFRKMYGHNSATFDIGYSARPSFYISSLLGEPIDTYFCNINHSEALRHAEMGGFRLKTFFDGKPTMIGHAYEMMVSALAPSTIKYDIVDGKVKEVFEEYYSSSTFEFAMNTMQEAAIDFVSTLINVFEEDINTLYFQNYYISLPFQAYLNSSREIDKYPFSSVIFEDDLSMGGLKKMIKVWQEELYFKNQTNLSTLYNLEAEDEDFNLGRLSYHSKVELKDESKFKRLLFYILFDKETFHRRMNDVKNKIKKKFKRK